MFEVAEEYDIYGIIESKESNDLFLSIDPSHEKDEDNKKDTTTSVFSDINPNDITGSIMSQCADIGERIGVHPLVAYILLANQNWNKHRLYESYSQLSNTMLGQIGITPDQALEDPSIHFLEGDETMECEVCFEEYPKSQFLSLPCGHIFCINCWKNHVNSSISSGHYIISCPEITCLRKLPPDSVQLICGKEIYNNLLKFIMDLQVNLADTLTVCPNPKCSRPINVLNMGICDVIKCSCGFEFCSLCKEESHAPCSCAMKQQWLMTTDEEVMQKRMFGPGIKQCPFCKVIIEKNEGCNYMDCRNCHQQFCWLCLGPWSKHNDHFRCPYYKLEDDPYLKPFDNVNRALIEKYNEPFGKFQYYAKTIKANKEKNSKAIASKIASFEQDLNPKDITQQIDLLFDELYQTYINLQWANPYVFFQDYEKVKDKSLHEQINVPPSTSQEMLFKFALEDLKAAADKLSTKIEKVVKKKSDISFKEIMKMTKQLKIFRNALLKQVDPHYHVNFINKK